MKKKEVIFYEADSFPSPGPEILELKADNKGNFVEGGSRGLEIQLTKRRIKNFLKKMDEIDVWNWEKNYSIGEICDGHMWKLKIIYHDKAKYCSGYDYFPRNFKKFIKELSDLMGVEINIV